MKKSLFVIIALLLSTLCSHAVNWQEIQTGDSNLSLYVDTDTIKQINATECVYAIRFRVGNAPEKVAYIKSNSEKNYIGIIQSGDFESDKYCPIAIFQRPYALMKPLNENTILSYAHNNIIEKTFDIAKNIPQDNDLQALNFEQTSLRNTDENINLVSYTSYETEQVPHVKNYISNIAQKLEENWQPPKSGRNTKTVIMMTVGADGGLYDYQIIESSEDETTDRSVITAIEKSVPYKKFPMGLKKSSSVNLKYTFEYKLTKKSVI